MIGFNKSAVVFEYASLPPASTLALASTDSDISTAFDPLYVRITFAAVVENHDKDTAGLNNVVVNDDSKDTFYDDRNQNKVPSDCIIHLRASDLTTFLSPGSPVLSWQDHNNIEIALNASSVTEAPILTHDEVGAGVVFGNGIGNSWLQASIAMSAATSILAVFRDHGR